MRIEFGAQVTKAISRFHIKKVAYTSTACRWNWACLAVWQAVDPRITLTWTRTVYTEAWGASKTYCPTGASQTFCHGHVTGLTTKRCCYVVSYCAFCTYGGCWASDTICGQWRTIVTVLFLGTDNHQCISTYTNRAICCICTWVGCTTRKWWTLNFAGRKRTCYVVPHSQSWGTNCCINTNVSRIADASTAY